MSFSHLVSSTRLQSLERRQIEITAQPSIMTSMCSETKCAQRELPPELVDRIIDFLYDEPRALAACSLAARSWTATSRYHRFSTVRLISREDWAKFDHLIEISPTMIRYMRNVTIDVTGVHSARWFPLCTSFTSLEHITMFGAIIPPWQPQALALSNVAPKITSFALDVALVSRYDFWPVIRMFPNLVSLRPVEARYGTELRLVWSSSLPCYSPPISSISVITAGEGHVLDDLCNPPYPLTSLSALDIRDVSHERRSGLQALVETYAGQITQLRLHVQTHSDRCTSSVLLPPFSTLLMHCHRFTQLHLPLHESSSFDACGASSYSRS